MDSQAARFVVAHQTSDTRRESSGSSLSEGISPDSSFAIDNSPAQTHLKTSSSTAGQSTNVPDTSGAMEEDGRNDGTIKSPKKGPIRHNPFSPVPLPTTQSSPPTIAIQGSTYEPRHSFSSSIDSTTSSFSSFNHSPGDQSSINPSNASPSRQSYQSNQSQRAASGNYRGTSPTPSDVSTRSTRNRFATVSPSMPDPTRGREKRRTTTRKARLENSSAAPYSYTSSRESSLGPGLEQNAGGHYDGGLSELMAEARVEDRRRDFGYESSNWSDGSADIEVDTPADADYVQSRSKGKGAKDDRSSDEEDGDFDMEERPTTAVVKKESPKKRGPYKKNLTLDIRTESGNDIVIEKRTNADDAEARRVAFERMAGAFRSATTGSARDKAKGAFVQAWLAYSYEESPGGNVCRPAIYGSYTRACQVASVTPINSASFGKAMRTAFPKIKTRRLGVRGNSRYHYCGIGPSNETEAAILVELGQDEPDDESTSSNAESGGSQKRRYPAQVVTRNTDSESDAPRSPIPATPTTARPKNPDRPMTTAQQQAAPPLPSSRRPRNPPKPISVPTNRHSQSGERTAGARGGPPGEIPIALRAINDLLEGFPDIEVALRKIAGGNSSPVDEDVVRIFWRSYAELCYGMLGCIKSGRFDQFEGGVQSFWASLNKATAIAVQHPDISSMIYRADAAIYDSILEILHSQILVHMPPPAFLALRSLADNMERIQTNALAAYEGQPFPGPKIELAARFGHLVQRHLGLCQLAQAMLSIVGSKETVEKLAQSWEAIDLEAVKNQSALVSNCAHDLLTECFDRFRYLLHNPGKSPAESIITWADQVYQTCLAAPSAGMSPRSLLIRFNFVTSQIMRDLVLRSEPNFGSWQIISLFLDEFLGFQVLRRVALQISAIAEEVVPSSVGKEGRGVDFGGYSMQGPPSTQQPQQHNYAPSSYGSSIAPSSTSFAAFDQFSPNTRQFIDHTAAQIIHDYHPPPFEVDHRPSQSSSQHYIHFQPQETRYGRFSMSDNGDNYQSYPAQFPSSISSATGSSHFDQSSNVGLGIGTPNYHVVGDSRGGEYGGRGEYGGAAGRGAREDPRLGEMRFDTDGTSSFGFSPQLL